MQLPAPPLLPGLEGNVAFVQPLFVDATSPFVLGPPSSVVFLSNAF
jgi:hypothetical protein